VKYTVLAVGRIRPPFADDEAHYRRLLTPHARVELIEVRDDAALERRIPERAHRVLLDVTGRAYDSPGFARWLEARRQAGRDVCFLLGGPEGTAVQACDERLSLGALTFPHQLARVLLLEQLFRAHKILAGEPYHH
jgi:23S rRNA (pseudouridine1915-N3)-methyltransferase